MSTVSMDCRNLGNLKADLVKVSMMSVFSRYAMGKSFSQDFVKDTVITLIAFVIYHVGIAPLAHVQQIDGSNKPADKIQKNIIYIGSVKIIAAIIGGKNISSEAVVKDMIFTIVGFCLYDLFSKDFVKSKNFTGLQGAIVHDMALFGGLFVVYQLLQNGQFDSKWITSTGASLAGLIVGNMLFLP